jgi:nicotinate-nucleotide adenylyltransferase
MHSPHLRSGPSFAGARVGLLGGSFNPAHEGHLAISRYALKRLGLDQIWWLVSPQNPLKPARGMAPLAQRLAAAKKIAHAHPRIAVTAIEARLGTRYTVDTLKALRRRFPKARFVWLMGADNFGQMPRWRDWPAIFRLVPIAVLRRPAYAAGHGTGKAARRFARHWRQGGEGKGLARAVPPVWLVLHNPQNALSATEIRKDREERK